MKLLSKLFIKDNVEAVPINGEIIADYTLKLLKYLDTQPVFKEMLDLKFSNDSKQILEKNKEIVSTIPKQFLSDFYKQIKQYSVLRFIKPREEEIKNYFTTVIDIFSRPQFRSQLEKQIVSKRQMHGYLQGVLKHLWVLSFLLYLREKKTGKRICYARAALYHDSFILDTNGYWGDFTHDKLGAELARSCGESKTVIKIINHHFLGNIAKLKYFPLSFIIWKFIFYDGLCANWERWGSLGRKVKILLSK